MAEHLWLQALYDDYDNWKQWTGDVDPDAQLVYGLELARLSISPPARVLEIGFGTGQFLVHLNACGYRASGVERRTEHNDTLLALGIEVSDKQLSDLADMEYDLVCAFDVLEHLDKQELINMMREVRRILKPNGKFMARFPNGGSPFATMIQNGDLTHLTALNPSSFSQLCSIGGLRYLGAYNEASTARSSRWTKRLFKPVLLMARTLIEIVLSRIYYGERRPLGVNLVVHAQRPH